MNTAAIANEIKSNIGPMHMLADAFDAEYLEEPYEPVDVEALPKEERQRVSAAMAEWWS